MRPALLAILATLAPAGLAAQPAPTDLAVGQIIGNEPGQVINGWTHRGGSMIPRRKTANYVTTETMECCAAIFERGDAVLVARTIPVARNDKGGVLAERIVEIVKLEKRPGEISAGDCSLLWIVPAWTLLNERTKAARSLVVTADGIEQVSWIDEHGSCYLGD